MVTRAAEDMATTAAAMGAVAIVATEARVAEAVVARSSHLATAVLTKAAHLTNRAVATASAKLVVKLTRPTVRTTHHRAWAAKAQCPNTQLNQRNSNGVHPAKTSLLALEAIITVRQPASHLIRTKVVEDRAHTRASRLTHTARPNRLLFCRRSRVLGAQVKNQPLSKTQSPLKVRKSEWLSLNHRTLTIRRRRKNQKRNRRKQRLKPVQLLQSKTC